MSTASALIHRNRINYECGSSETADCTVERYGSYGRVGKPEELQSILVYLAGDSCPFTTGSDIVVDGAFTCF